MWVFWWEIVTKESKTQNVRKLKNSNFEEKKKLKTQVATKLKNLNCDKTQIVLKLKKSNCGKNPNFKLWEKNAKKLKNSDNHKTQKPKL